MLSTLSSVRPGLITVPGGAAATLTNVVSIPLCQDVLPADEPVLRANEVSARVGLSVSRVYTMVSQGQLLAFRRDGEIVFPATFFDEDGVAKHVTGLLAVLFDGGFSRDEALSWLFTEQDDLGEVPARALHTHQAREVIRRAQAQAF